MPEEVTKPDESQAQAQAGLNEEEASLASVDFDDFVEDLPDVTPAAPETEEKTPSNREGEPETETKPEDNSEDDEPENNDDEPENNDDEPENNDDEPENNDDEPETKSVIEIDGEKYEPEQIKEFKKAYENMQSWQKNLTEKSQIAANLTEDQIRAIMKVTQGLRTITVPEEYDTPVKEIDMLDDKPFMVEVEDSEGLPAEVDLKPYLKPFIKQYENKVAELTQKLEKVSQETEAAKQAAILNEMRSNMQKFPDIAIDDVSIENIDRIMRAGKTHPDYEKLMRYKMVVNYARETDMPFEKAYKKLYIKEIVADKEAERLKKNSQEQPPEPPAKTPPKTQIDELYDEEFGGEDLVGKINALP